MEGNVAEVAEGREEQVRHDKKHLQIFVPHNENLKFGVLNYLADNVDVVGQRVTVLETLAEEDGGESRFVILFKVREGYEYQCNFEVTVNEKPFEFRVMQVHSKSRHRVYYTLNAMNRLIFKETGEENNRTHQLDWSKYSEKIIYLAKNAETDERELKIVPTKLVGVVNLNPQYEIAD